MPVNLKQWRVFFENLLFPVSCLGCSRPKVWLCDDCLTTISVFKDFLCPVCSQKSIRGQTHSECQHASFLTGTLIAADWQNKLLRRAIHVYKYNFVEDLSQPLSQIFLKKFVQADKYFSPYLSQGYFDFLIAVPLHRRRLLWRGFNQAEVLAKNLVERVNIKLLTNAVDRTRYTSPQVGKKSSRRSQNLKNAFKINPEYKNIFQNKKILLIDDVITTGSTVQELAKLFKQHGATEVWAMALARG